MEVFFQHKKPSQRLDFKEIMKKIHSSKLGVLDERQTSKASCESFRNDYSISGVA